MVGEKCHQQSGQSKLQQQQQRSTVLDVIRYHVNPVGLSHFVFPPPPPWAIPTTPFYLPACNSGIWLSSGPWWSAAPSPVWKDVMAYPLHTFDDADNELSSSGAWFGRHGSTVSVYPLQRAGGGHVPIQRAPLNRSKHKRIADCGGPTRRSRAAYDVTSYPVTSYGIASSDMKSYADTTEKKSRDDSCGVGLHNTAAFIRDKKFHRDSQLNRRRTDEMNGCFISEGGGPFVSDGAVTRREGWVGELNKTTSDRLEEGCTMSDSGGCDDTKEGERWKSKSPPVRSGCYKLTSIWSPARDMEATADNGSSSSIYV